MSMREFLDLVHERWKTHSECGWLGLGWMKNRTCDKEPYSSLSASWQQTHGTSCSVLPWWWLSAVGCTGKLWAQTKSSGVTLVMVGNEKAFSVLSKRWKGRRGGQRSKTEKLGWQYWCLLRAELRERNTTRTQSGTCLKQTQSHTNRSKWESSMGKREGSMCVCTEMQPAEWKAAEEVEVQYKMGNPECEGPWLLMIPQTPSRVVSGTENPSVQHYVNPMTSKNRVNSPLLIPDQMRGWRTGLCWPCFPDNSQRQALPHPLRDIPESGTKREKRDMSKPRGPQEKLY